MALSDGRTFDMPKLLTPGEQRRLLGLERKAARQRLANQQQHADDPNAQQSKRYQRTLGQIAALHARQARRRQDWLHKVTTELAKSHGLVVLEDLRVQNMTRSARGTIEQPGGNVRAKAGLNSSILGMAWGKAGQMLAYKCSRHGGRLLKVNPRNSSIECACCGHVAKENRVSQSVFRCARCGHGANADINAAQVLLARGLTAHSGATQGCRGTAREARATAPHRVPPGRRTRPMDGGRVIALDQESSSRDGEEIKTSISAPRAGPPVSRSSGNERCDLIVMKPAMIEGGLN